MAKSMRMGKFRPPQLRNRLTDFDEIQILELPSEDHPPFKINFTSIGRRGWSRQIPSLPLLGFCLCLSFFFGLFVTRTGRTGGPILTICTSYDIFLPKDVPFADMLPHLRGSNPPKTPMNRRFPAKLLKSKNMHIIKPTASIPTKFCTMIKTTKCPSWVVQTHITNPRWRTAAILEKSKNRHISAAI